MKLSKTDYSKKTPGKYSKEVGVSFSQNEDGSISLFSKTYSGYTSQNYHFYKKKFFMFTLKDCYINVKVKRKMEDIFTLYKVSNLRFVHYDDLEDNKFYTSVEAHRFNIMEEQTTWVDSPKFKTYAQCIDKIKSFREIELAVKEFVVNTPIADFKEIIEKGTRVAWSTISLEFEI